MNQVVNLAVKKNFNFALDAYQVKKQKFFVKRINMEKLDTKKFFENDHYSKTHS
jgi:hypothetical protein